MNRYEIKLIINSIVLYFLLPLHIANRSFFVRRINYIKSRNSYVSIASQSLLNLHKYINKYSWLTTLLEAVFDIT